MLVIWLLEDSIYLWVYSDKLLISVVLRILVKSDHLSDMDGRDLSIKLKHLVRDSILSSLSSEIQENGIPEVSDMG